MRTILGMLPFEPHTLSLDPRLTVYVARICLKAFREKDYKY